MAEKTKPEVKERISESQMNADVISTSALLKKQEQVKIRLPQYENASPEEVVQINGYTYQIKRGVEVEVPLTVKEVLEQAGRL